MLQTYICYFLEYTIYNKGALVKRRSKRAFFYTIKHLLLLRPYVTEVSHRRCTSNVTGTQHRPSELY